ncbi:Ger(x)C family spore germination protein [Calidifontibacillus oryziterrae]|uniref:Ger(x)C family spore germination protein n=1 Tax=Calidifontibacillus oryziterrae TaxID=1191699 RepID=UPI00036E332D|nr:Ger(x)C family spore germination protein [Calidifontibacillus oryziterrae]
MKKNILFLTLLSICIASGFSMTPRIIDDIFMVMIVGYDYVEENLIKGTVVAPNYKADNTIENIAFTDVSSIVYENRDKLEAKSPRPLISGKLEAALFNSELAERGIIEYVDNLQRDPIIGSRVYLAIFEGSTEKFLQKPRADVPTGVYISRLIEQNNAYDNLPKTNLHIFSYQFFSKGMDPFLPLLKEENDKVAIKGLALFKHDKMVSELPRKDFLYFRGLYEHFDNGTMFLKLENDDLVFLTTIKSYRDFEVKYAGKQFNPTVTIFIKMEGIVREYTGRKITPKIVKAIEQQINKNIEENANRIVKEFQEVGIDPIGIGDHVRNRNRNWDEKKWKDIYPTVEVNVKAEFEILEHGIIK